jgi:branched-chain amino acid transport system permease protein
VGVAALALAPFAAGGDYAFYVGAGAGLFALLAVGWAIPAWCGLFSFGQAAFFGVGAYAAAILATRGATSPWLGLTASAVMAVAAAAALGAACLHLRGPYFSLATLAAAEILRVFATNWESLTEGAQGIVGIPALPPILAGPFRVDLASRAGAYLLTLAVLAALLAAAWALRRTSAGAAWVAIRENEERAESLGVAAFRWKMAALLAGAAATGVAGALHAHALRHLDPATAFHPQFSVMPMVMGFVGGADRLAGPLLGALALYLVNELLLQRWFPTLHLLFYGVAIALAILYLPRGIAGRLAAPRSEHRGA